MFNNIGGKIKSVASVLTGLGIAISIVIGIIAIIASAPGIGLLTIFLGSLASWLSSLTLYGFGQLIENTDKLVKMQTQIPNLTQKQNNDAESNHQD